MKNNFGWVYLLPSEATRVAVKYYPKWLISCVLPETKRSILARRVDYRTDVAHEGKLDIRTPDLILSHSLDKPWVKNAKVDAYYSIHRIDLSKTHGIHAQPYRLANVYSSGKICWGFDPPPKNLREANNLFWVTPFNEDNCPFLDKHIAECSTKQHDYLSHLYNDRCDCECCIDVCGCLCLCDLNKGFFGWLQNYYDTITQQKTMVKTKHFCGDKYFACPKPAKALFLSNHEALLKKLPKETWRKDGQGATVVIGLVEEKSKTHWRVDLGSTSFSIPKTQVAFV